MNPIKSPLIAAIEAATEIAAKIDQPVALIEWPGKPTVFLVTDIWKGYDLEAYCVVMPDGEIRQ